MSSSDVEIVSYFVYWTDNRAKKEYRNSCLAMPLLEKLPDEQKKIFMTLR